MTEAQEKANAKYRASKTQLSITIDNSIKKIIDKAAAASGKSKAQYIVDLIVQDNEKNKY